jgi:hypothetical protein
MLHEDLKLESILIGWFYQMGEPLTEIRLMNLPVDD